MELEAYKEKLAECLRAWIIRPNNIAFTEACRAACSGYLSTRTGGHKRRENVVQLSKILTPENALHHFLNATSEDCWEIDYHLGGLFGCASFNTLLMYHVIVNCNQDTWQQLEESKISESYGQFIQLCKATDTHIKNGSLQNLCHDIYKCMKPLELIPTHNKASM